MADATTSQTTFQTILRDLALVPEDGERGLRFCYGREGNDHAGLYLSWPAVARRINGITQRLHDAGITAGDVVIVHAHDQLTAMLAIFGCIRYGAIPAAVAPVGAGTAARLIAQFHAIIQSADARAIIVDKALDDAVLVGHAAIPTIITVETCTEHNAAQEVVTAQPHDPCFLQFTSGSTSTPKGVVVTHHMLLENIRSMSEVLGWDSTGRCVGWLPIYHDMSLVGIYANTAYNAARACFFPTSKFGRSPDMWLRLMAEERSGFSAGPNFAFAMIARLAERRPITDIDLSCVKGIICGSEPIAASVMRSFTAITAPLGLAQPIIPAFGMAESTLMASSCTPSAPLVTTIVDRAALEQLGRVIPGSAADLSGDTDQGGTNASASIELVGCGPAAPGFSITIERDGVVVGDDLVGEILLAGTSVMTTYWHNPAASAAAQTLRDGKSWFRTGDLGFTHHGHLYICGRAKDVIIHNGVNYYPADVEAAVQTALPDLVRLAAVVDTRANLADTFAGLGIICEPGKQVNDIDAAQQQVADYVKAYTGLPIARCLILPNGQHIPRTTSGKLVRPAIRDLLRVAP